MNYVYNMYNPQGDVVTRITNTFSSAGMNIADAYAWNVSWGAGSSVPSSIVRMSWNGYNFDMIPIDTTDTQWQSGSVNGPALYGTFNFPATFTPYNPITQLSNNNNWC